MQYFIPAWYRQGGWGESEQVWYRARTVTEFDDTVKQVQLFFRRHVAPFRILLLSHSPNFRHFLHRQGVYHAPYWSCFDAMQGVRSRAMRPFSLYDLTWPEDVSFVYTPFAVLAMRDGAKYAQVEFAEDGNMFRVDLFKDGARVSTNLYDDRGFVSCQVAYKGGEAVRQRFFDEQGVWKFARYVGDGHVVVNPKSAWYLRGSGDDAEQVPYRRQRYERIDDVIAEVLRDRLADTSPADVFTIAMHPRHAQVLDEVLANRPKVLSFFGRRMGEGCLSPAGRRLLDAAACVVADRQDTAATVRGLMGDRHAPLRVITPYETRVEFGVSQHLRVQNVLVAVDALDDDLFDAAVVALARYVRTRNSRARVCLFTRSSRYEARSGLLERVRAALRRAGLDPGMAGEAQGSSENGLSEEDAPAVVFSVQQCVDELRVSRTIREQRVVVDLSPLPDQFLQISAMSMGIPQVTTRETDYVVDGRNGRVLQGASGLADAVDYYLSSVEHFNEAQIASYDLGSRFTADQLVKAWKEVIALGESASAAARTD
ncbi:accessory Sec system protein Asp1 [bacterium]|nr:accessory Sec system protein Asp1 [bacterium]